MSEALIVMQAIRKRYSLGETAVEALKGVELRVERVSVSRVPFYGAWKAS